MRRNGKNRRSSLQTLKIDFLMLLVIAAPTTQRSNIYSNRYGTGTTTGTAYAKQALSRDRNACATCMHYQYRYQVQWARIFCILLFAAADCRGTGQNGTVIAKVYF